MNKFVELIIMAMKIDIGNSLESAKVMGALLTFAAGTAITTGTLWIEHRLESKVSNVELASTKGQIVNELTIVMSKKELARLETEISALNRRIEFEMCADPQCRFEKADIEDKKRVVEAIKEEIRLLSQKLSNNNL